MLESTKALIIAFVAAIVTPRHCSPPRRTSPRAAR